MGCRVGHRGGVWWWAEALCGAVLWIGVVACCVGCYCGCGVGRCGVVPLGLVWWYGGVLCVASWWAKALRGLVL